MEVRFLTTLQRPVTGRLIRCGFNPQLGKRLNTQPSSRIVMTAYSDGLVEKVSVQPSQQHHNKKLLGSVTVNLRRRVGRVETEEGWRCSEKRQLGVGWSCPLKGHLLIV